VENDVFVENFPAKYQESFRTKNLDSSPLCSELSTIPTRPCYF